VRAEREALYRGPIQRGITFIVAARVTFVRRPTGSALVVGTRRKIRTHRSRPRGDSAVESY
jgi:hypothetical protein